MVAVPVGTTSVFAGNVTKNAKLGNGEDCIQIGGHVQLDPISGALLADVLPRLIHVRATSPQSTILRWLLDQLVREQAANLSGAGIASAQLAQLMFVQILRAYLETSGPLTPDGFGRSAIGGSLLRWIDTRRSRPRVAA